MIPAVQVIGSSQAPAAAWFLHGILGSGTNWRAFARRLVEQAPGWKAVLVDLRNHGDSGRPPGPHSLQACADDLWELGAERGEPPRIVVGHSFGGKVALTYAGQAGRLGSTGAGALERVWVLDAFPSAWPGDPSEDAEVVTVMRALRSVPVPLARREEVVTLLRERGFSSSLAKWMTTNLRRSSSGYVWRFDLDAAEEMVADYFRQDLWPVLEHPGDGLCIDVVQAEHSDRWTAAELARFEQLPDDCATRLHLLPDSGHWVHVDNPDGLLALMLPSFRELQ